MDAVMERRCEAAAVLGVEVDAELDAVRAAYREAAKLTHPDTGGDAEQFAALTAAFETMSEPLPLDAAPVRSEVAAEAAGPQVQPRPEMPPLFRRDHVRVGVIVLSTPLLCALVVLVYVIAPGVAVAIVAFHVAGLWVRVGWIATGKPPLWRWARGQASRQK